MGVKQLQRSEIQGFSKGLQTDLNPLNSQLDTTRAESNFELHRDGTRSRRLGLNSEVGAITNHLGGRGENLSLSSYTSYLWDGAAGDSANKFIVVQVGSVLRLFNTNSPITYHSTINLPIPESASVQFAAVEGFLGIVTGSPEILLIEYLPTSDSFALTSFRIQIRDLFGIEETIQPLYESDPLYKGTLNWQHYYNLYNQGWAIPRKDWVYGDPAPTDAVWLGSKKLSPSNSPSNADSVWMGMDRKPIAENSLENFEAFNYRTFEGVTGADTKAAKGFFLIDAFSRGSARYDAWVHHRNKYPQTGGLLGGIAPPTDMSTGGPTSVASHAGRLFYSGCNGTVLGGDGRSPNYNNYVFFSQLIRSRREFPKCYQEGDPTSRDTADIVDTDGGFITVSGAVNIHTMYSMGDRLFLIAENGVWSVTGGSGYGFAATNYKVEKISTYGGIPNRSFVEFGGNGFFWGWDGIYSVAKNQFGEYEVTNLTKDTNDSFFSAISGSAKETCQGFVDKSRRQVRWVYTEGILFNNAITYEIIFDMKFKAMIPFTIAKHKLNNAYVLSGIQLGDFSVRYIEDGVYVGEEPVYVNDDPLVASTKERIALDNNVKYLVVHNVENLLLTFCEYNDVNFEDWAFTGTASDAYGYMETNAFTGGDFAVDKQVPYLTMAFAETEKLYNSTTETVLRESSCIGKFMWSFSNLSRSGKWSREQQLYRKNRFFYGDSDIDTGFSILTTKTKIRGVGKAFALRINTEPRKDCHIYGWNITLTSNGVT